MMAMQTGYCSCLIAKEHAGFSGSDETIFYNHMLLHNCTVLIQKVFANALVYQFQCGPSELRIVYLKYSMLERTATGKTIKTLSGFI